MLKRYQYVRQVDTREVVVLQYLRLLLSLLRFTFLAAPTCASQN